MSGDVLHVACAATPEYVRHSAAMLHSVHEHRGDLRLHVHYLHDESVPARARAQLAEWLEGLGAAVTLHAVAPDRVAGLEGRWPLTIWFRALLPALLPDLPRVLYLDVDTLAVDQLGPLWRHDLGGRPLGAVTNVLIHPNHREYVAGLGVPAERYLNSGVLLLDLERLRACDATERLLAYGRREGQRLLAPDQDALSVVLGEDRAPLHPRWNAMNSVMLYPEAVAVFGAEQVEEAQARPGIRHFEGPSINKPWHHRCRSPLSERYRHHRRQTPWPRYRPEGRTLRARLRR